MGLHADRVDHRVGAPAVGVAADDVFEVVLAEVDDVFAVLPRATESFVDQVDADDAAVRGGMRSGTPSTRSGPRPSTTSVPPSGHFGVLDGLPGGGQHVGQVHVALVGPVLGHLDVGVLGLGHPQIFGLPAGHLAVELGVAEQRGARALIAVLRGLALALQALAAHEAVPAADVERDHHAIADFEVVDLTSDFLDDAHGLVAEDVARTHERAEHLVQMQIRPTDVGARDADDRVAGFLDRRVGHRVDGHLPPSLPRDCSHRVASLRFVVLYWRAHLRDRQTSRQDGCMAAGGTVVELRVHGVSGTPPEALLSCPTEFLEEVAGDKSAGFYRRQPWLDDATSGPPGAWRKVLEAYSWGGLTSGPASRAVWLLFLPFIFINLAHWMLPPATKQRFAAAVSVGLLRLIALSFTLTLMLAAAVAVMDVMVWQCMGLDYCGSTPGVRCRAWRRRRAARRWR